MYKKDGPEGPPSVSIYTCGKHRCNLALVATTKDVQDAQEHVDDVHEQVGCHEHGVGQRGRHRRGHIGVVANKASADVLHSVFERYGTKRDGGMTALGFEIYGALSIVTRYRERLFGDDREPMWG